MKRFAITECHPKFVPADPNAILSACMEPQTKEENIDMQTIPYGEFVGALLYITNMTRPDISYAVGQKAKFCQNPQTANWKEVKRIFSYLNGTVADLGLWLAGREKEGFVGYTDADFAGGINNRRSTSGAFFFYHDRAVSSTSRKQTFTALSNNEAEYIAACEATKTAVWLSSLIKDIEGANASTEKNRH